MNNIGQYIESLARTKGYRQSDIARHIGVPRQLLSYAVGGKRELSLPMVMKLESFFNLPEGELLKMQVEERVRTYKQGLKSKLIERLQKANAFWSYTDVSADNIPDEELIERTFVSLDLRDIAILFELYQRDYIRTIWKEKMAVQGDYLFQLNVMIALYYFDIKQPEKYLKRVEREHVNQQLSYA
jgi:plasmid maintenance system antidote protein VapI